MRTHYGHARFIYVEVIRSVLLLFICLHKRDLYPPRFFFSFRIKESFARELNCVYHGREISNANVKANRDRFVRRQKRAARGCSSKSKAKVTGKKCLRNACFPTFRWVNATALARPSIHARSEGYKLLKTISSRTSSVFCLAAAIQLRLIPL